MKNQRGFTLIELLIVIAIIAILALIAIPNFLEAQTRAKVARAQSDMRSLATALEAYIVDYKVPPAVWVGSGTGLVDPVWVGSHYYYIYRARYSPFLLGPLLKPVAYITSLPPDVFQERNLDQVKADGATPVFDQQDFLYDSKKKGKIMTYTYEMAPTAFRAWNMRMGTHNYIFNENCETHDKNWREANGPADWMLISCGPDRDFWSGYRAEYNDPIFNGRWEPPTFTPPSGVPAPIEGCRMLVPWPLGCYDPTNGSISWGSIRRTGDAKHSN